MILKIIFWIITIYWWWYCFALSYWYWFTSCYWFCYRLCFETSSGLYCCHHLLPLFTLFIDDCECEYHEVWSFRELLWWWFRAFVGGTVCGGLVSFFVIIDTIIDDVVMFIGYRWRNFCGCCCSVYCHWLLLMFKLFRFWLLWLSSWLQWLIYLSWDLHLYQKFWCHFLFGVLLFF